MKVERIRVGEVGPKGQYQSIRVELEAKLDEDEDVSRAIDALHNRVIEELRRLREGKP